jgi:hypothetical protein
MAQCPYAWWMPINKRYNPGMMSKSIQGLVIHITAKAGLAGTRAWFNRDFEYDANGNKSYGASAHFCISKGGEIWQFVDTNDRAWAIDGGSNDACWFSVENEGAYGDSLTDEQVNGCAQLLNYLNQEFGVPLQTATDNTQMGLGYHSMFHIGDHNCPGPVIVGQLDDIVLAASLVDPSDIPVLVLSN